MVTSVQVVKTSVTISPSQDHTQLHNQTKEVDLSSFSLVFLLD